MQRCWDKYGPAAFTWEILEPWVEGDIWELEQKWIDQLQPALNGTKTARPGADKTLEQLQRVRELGRNNKGRRHTPAAREHMSKARVGVPHSTEHRQKLTAVNRGRARRLLVSVSPDLSEVTLYECMADAKRAGYGFTYVKRAAKDGGTYRGLHWAYLDEIQAT